MKWFNVYKGKITPHGLIGLRTGTRLTPHKALSLCTRSSEKPRVIRLRLASTLHVFMWPPPPHPLHTHLLSGYTHTYMYGLCSHLLRCHRSQGRLQTKLMLISRWRSAEVFFQLCQEDSGGQMETWQNNGETKQLFVSNVSHFSFAVFQMCSRSWFIYSMNSYGELMKHSQCCTPASLTGMPGTAPIMLSLSRTRHTTNLFTCWQRQVVH